MCCLTYKHEFLDALLRSFGAEKLISDGTRCSLSRALLRCLVGHRRTCPLVFFSFSLNAQAHKSTFRPSPNAHGTSSTTASEKYFASISRDNTGPRESAQRRYAALTPALDLKVTTTLREPYELDNSSLPETLLPPKQQRSSSTCRPVDWALLVAGEMQHRRLRLERGVTPRQRLEKGADNSTC